MKITYKKQNIIISWVEWHFYQAPGFLFFVIKNYLSFYADFFSISLLLSTLFSPWRKTSWSYSKRFAIGAYLGNLVTNSFSRVLGAVLRLWLIIVGTVAQVIVFALGVAVLLLWIFSPLICVLLVIFLLYV